MNIQRTVIGLMLTVMLVGLFLPIGERAMSVASAQETRPTIGLITIPAMGLNRAAIAEVPLVSGNGSSTWAVDLWEPNVMYFAGTRRLASGGNTLIGAHSTYPDGSAGLFYSLDVLKAGDTVVVEMGDTTLTYAVTSIYVTRVSDLTPVYRTRDERLTLITCLVSDNNYRLVVVAQRVS